MSCGSDEVDGDVLACKLCGYARAGSAGVLDSMMSMLLPGLLLPVELSASEVGVDDVE